MTTYFQHERLIITEHQARSLTKIALRDAGVPAADAANVAAALVDTSLRGIETHGLRLLPRYLDELATGVAGQREFTAGLAELLSTVRAAAPANSSQPDLAPGDPLHAHQRERWGRGIPLDARAADVLSALAASIGVPLRGAAVVTDDADDEIAS